MRGISRKLRDPFEGRLESIQHLVEGFGQPLESRRPPWESPAAALGNNTVEVLDLKNRTHLKSLPGSVYTLAPAATVASKPLGQWNSYETTAQGNTVTVVLNGQQVSQLLNGNRSQKGFIGLQKHHFGSVCSSGISESRPYNGPTEAVGGSGCTYTRHLRAVQIARGRDHESGPRRIPRDRGGPCIPLFERAVMPH